MSSSPDRRGTRPRGVWLVDGHNVIHQVPELARLQVDDRGEAARARLEEACRRFVLRRRLRVVLVFDGLPAGSPSRARPHPDLEVVYASEPGRADARIVSRARRLAGEKTPVTVVTADRGILRELLRGAEVRSPLAFWEMTGPGAAPSDAEEKAPGPMEDVERHFLEAEARAKKARVNPRRRP